MTTLFLRRNKNIRLILLLMLLATSLFIFAASVNAQPVPVPPGPPPVPPGPPPVEPQTYLSNLYIWFLGFIGIAALFAIVWGGIQYMFSGANLTKAESGRTWITNAIWGIVLAASAYLILYTINPDLVTHGFDINLVIDNALKTK